jgi:mRNA-degrading endonuclease RelE of RelBE toxin-antitoxin system
LKPKYTVVLSRQAEHFYKKLDVKIKAKVQECLISLEEDAYLGKRLRGDLKENYSLRVGKKLRIVYTVSDQDSTVYVVAIGPRKNIYQ